MIYKATLYFVFLTYNMYKFKKKLRGVIKCFKC